MSRIRGYKPISAKRSAAIHIGRLAGPRSPRSALGVVPGLGAVDDLVRTPTKRKSYIRAGHRAADPPILHPQPPIPDGQAIPHSVEYVQIVLDLPFPPSTNRIWRRGPKGMHKSAEYAAWLRNADMHVMATGQFPKRKITGPFSIVIQLSDCYRGDGDNRIKALLDWLQSREIVRNDVDCRSGSWIWVAPAGAPEGCRITVWQEC